MKNQETIHKLSQDFLSRLKLPAKKSDSSFVIAIIGLVGSGRTTVAKRIAECVSGAVLVQSNSARFLLKEAGLPWGENVRQILKEVAKDLLSKGYGVVFDGNASDKEDRKNIYEIVRGTGAKTFYVRITIDPELAKEREQKKYDVPDWISSFEDFRVNTTKKMLKNIDDRIELYRVLRLDQILNLVGDIDNNGTLKDLNQQIDQIVLRIKQSP